MWREMAEFELRKAEERLTYAQDMVSKYGRQTFRRLASIAFDPPYYLGFADAEIIAAIIVSLTPNFFRATIAVPDTLKLVRFTLFPLE